MPIHRKSCIPGTWEHQDLWHDLGALLDAAAPEQFAFHWVPSHLDKNRCESPFEDWLRKWNGIADRVAGHMNDARSGYAEALFTQIIEYDAWRSRQDHLFRFLVDAGGARVKEATEQAPLVVCDSEPEEQQTLNEAIVAHGDIHVESSRMPPSFFQEVVSWLQRKSSSSERRRF